MDSFQATVRSVGLGASGRRTAQIELSTGPQLQPGQALLAYPLQTPETALRYTLYPSELSVTRFRVRLPRGSRWEPGDLLDLWGPIGSGFSPPDQARRWLLTALDSGFDMLLPLLEMGRERGSSIAVLGRAPTDALPPEVEVLRDPEEALAWAEYLGMVATRASLAAVRSVLGLDPGMQPGPPAEVLIADELPCGFGACGACPVKINAGWGWACKDGPVFSLDDLAF